MQFLAIRRCFSNASDLAYEPALLVLKNRQDKLRKMALEDGGNMYIRDQLAFSSPHLSSQWKLNKTELKIPKFFEMSNAEWRRNKGPELTRLQAKAKGLIPSIFPDETEAMLNMSCSFGGNTVGRGNYIVPDDCMEKPVIRFSTSSTDMPKHNYYSFILFDCDYPVPSLDPGKLHQMILWMVANVYSPSNGNSSTDELEMENPVVIDGNSPNQVFPYIPPHPARGIGLPRYICVLLSHAERIPQIPSELFSAQSDDKTILGTQRVFQIDSFIKNFGLHVASYSWFISSWTQYVSELYLPSNILSGAKEYVYGIETKDRPYDIRPYRFKYC